jgi:hypothetical protein
MQLSLSALPSGRVAQSSQKVGQYSRYFDMFNLWIESSRPPGSSLGEPLMRQRTAQKRRATVRSF